MYKSCLVALIIISTRAASFDDESDAVIETTELPEPFHESNIYFINLFEDQEARTNSKNISAIVKTGAAPSRLKNQRRKNSTLGEAIRIASLQGFNAMIDLYERKEPEILRKGQAIKQLI